MINWMDVCRFYDGGDNDDSGGDGDDDNGGNDDDDPGLIS